MPGDSVSSFSVGYPATKSTITRSALTRSTPKMSRNPRGFNGEFDPLISTYLYWPIPGLFITTRESPIQPKKDNAPPRGYRMVSSESCRLAVRASEGRVYGEPTARREGVPPRSLPFGRPIGLVAVGLIILSETSKFPKVGLRRVSQEISGRFQREQLHVWGGGRLFGLRGGAKREDRGRGRQARKVSSRPFKTKRKIKPHPPQKFAKSKESSNSPKKIPRYTDRGEELEESHANGTAKKRRRRQHVELDAQAFQQFPEVFAKYFIWNRFRTPTPIQRLSWRPLLNGLDAQIIAQTGSGKTLAFLLPAVRHLPTKTSIAKKRGVRVLIIEPTRELANQVYRASTTFKSLLGVTSKLLVGGEEGDAHGIESALIKTLDERDISSNSILVGTPGRLCALLNRTNNVLDGVTYLVLDEADKLLDMGLIEQVKAIRSNLNLKTLQTVFCSATFPKALERITELWTRANRTKTLTTSVDNPRASIPTTVTQYVLVVSEGKKLRKLTRFLAQIKAEERKKRIKQPRRVLIFVNTIQQSRYVFRTLEKVDYKVALLHGKRTQKEREQALKEFREGKKNILVATDVAGRGLHIRNIPFVVNFDFPHTMTQYINRVGRTGRLEQNGTALSFFTAKRGGMASKLISILKATGQHIPEELEKLAKVFKEAESQNKTRKFFTDYLEPLLESSRSYGEKRWKNWVDKQIDTPDLDRLDPTKDPRVQNPNTAKSVKKTKSSEGKIGQKSRKSPRYVDDGDDEEYEDSEDEDEYESENEGEDGSEDDDEDGSEDDDEDGSEDDGESDDDDGFAQMDVVGSESASNIEIGSDRVEVLPTNTNTDDDAEAPLPKTSKSNPNNPPMKPNSPTSKTGTSKSHEDRDMDPTEHGLE
ncbi:hypothetical protein AAMO2058_001349600 [Amorphochlora amoebiformis]